MRRLVRGSYGLSLIAGIAVIIFAHPSVYGRLMSIPDLKKLTNDSTLAGVAEVLGTRDLGPATFTNSRGDQIKGRHVVTLLRFEEVLKGDPNTGSVDVEYDENRDAFFRGGPMTPLFNDNSRVLVFLKCNAQHCTATNPENTSFHIAAKTLPVPDPPDASPYHLILQRVAAGIFRDNQTPPDPKRPSDVVPSELSLLRFERDPYVDSLFHAAIDRLNKANDGNLRAQLIGALVARGDTAMLPQLEEALYDSSLQDITRQNLLYPLQEVDWHLALPIAARMIKDPSPSVRYTSAQIIPNLHALKPSSDVSRNELIPAANDILLPALYDPDPQVVFAVMQSLGAMNGRLDQRPMTTAQNEQWNSCLHFWESFAKDQQLATH